MVVCISSLPLYTIVVDQSGVLRGGIGNRAPEEEHGVSPHFPFSPLRMENLFII